MTAVLEIGPETVRGPGPVPRQKLSPAIRFIDDPCALLGEEPVAVSELWREVLDAAAGGRRDLLVLVVPTWWPAGRVECVRDAAQSGAREIVVLTRSSLLAVGTDSTVAELSTDYAVVTPPGSDALVLRRDDPEFVRQLGASDSLLLDVPAAVPPLPVAVIAGLRRLGTPVTRCTDDRLRCAALAAANPRAARTSGSVIRVRPGRRATAVMAGAALTAAAAGGGWAAQALGAEPVLPRPDADTRQLVDGGVAVRVPASWTAERITSGSGSARIRVSAPEGSPALHITQSTAAMSGTITEVAESLRRAIDSERDGAFAEFDPSADRAGRPAVTYVENRPGSLTRWAVIVDGATRIAIGCQSIPSDPVAVEAACLEAVRSAHVMR